MWKDPGRLAEGIEGEESPLDIDRSRDKRRSQDMLIKSKKEKKEKRRRGVLICFFLFSFFG